MRRVETCDDAVARARELLVSGRLRGVCIGGGERPAVCGPTCTRDHSGDGNCVRCGRD